MKKKNCENLQNSEICKEIAFFSKNFYVILFFTLQIFYSIFCNFQKFAPKRDICIKIFFCKNKVFNSIPIEVLLQCFVENLADFEL